MATHMKARFAPDHFATVVARFPLRYEEGADPALDRPVHVRAGSALAWVDDRLVVIQDDANFIALIDPDDGAVVAIPLPVGHGGVRQFDDLRGNKAWKLDLEAAVTVPSAFGDILLAFGSGSTSRREQVLIAKHLTGGDPLITLVEASRLYAALRAQTAFAGSELNIEGAVLIGDDRVRLFQRGNGAPHGDLDPVDATCELLLEPLMAYLERPDAVEPPQPQEIVRYDLGEIDGVRLTFTDAAAGHLGVLYLAAAEASPDAVQDGPVVGVVLGEIDTSGEARYTRLRTRDGLPFIAKAEGLALDPDDIHRAYAVLDLDHPLSPSELVVIQLAGPW